MFPRSNSCLSSPMLLLMRGLPGCGKSTFAVQLAKELGWPLVDKDHVRGGLSVLEDAVPRDRLNACAYDVLCEVAEAQLATGLSVIVDTPLSRTALAERFGQLAAKASISAAEDSITWMHACADSKACTPQYSAQVGVLECWCSTDTWRSRLAQRAERDKDSMHTHKPQSWEALQQLIAGYDGCHLWQPAELSFPATHLKLDLSSDVKEPLEQALQWLQDQHAHCSVLDSRPSHLGA